METAMRNVSINDRTTPTMSPIIKTETSTQQDQPLDFSTKVRVCTIDDDSVRKISNDSAIDCSNDNNTSRPESPCNLPTPTREPATGHHLPPEENRHNLIGQPRVSMPMPMPNINSFLPQNTMTAAAAGMGMFYPGSPMFPNLMPPGFNGSMWPNPMAAMMQQQQEAARKLIGQAATANKQSPLSMDNFNKQFMGKIGIPGAGRVFPNMPGFPGAGIGGGNLSNIPDPNILAEALKSHEEMFNAYKQQVLSQKATDEAKRGPRRHQPAATATATNGHSTSTPQTNGSHITPESNTLSQIIENQSDVADEIGTGTKANSDNSSEIDVSKETSSSSSSSSTSDEDKHSGAGSTGDLSQTTHSNHDPAQPTHSTMSAFPGQLLPGEDRTAPGALAGTGGIVGGVLLPPATNGQVLQGSTGTSLHSSDESLGTRHTDSSGRRSTTPAHSSTSDVHDLNGMRPRSMTLPTQSDSRTLSYSPSPSVLSTGNASSGPGTPNSKASGSFRKRARTLPDDQKVKRHRDEAYWERRRKNNEAAKRSRDSRRAKEDEIAIRAAFLEQENIRLRIELASLKTQTAKLRSELIIFQGPDDPPHRGHPHPADGS